LGFSKCRHGQHRHSYIGFILVFASSIHNKQQNSGGEDEDWGEGSGDEEEREEGDDDVIEVEPSGSRDSVKPILRLSERNEDDTDWTRVYLLHKIYFWKNFAARSTTTADEPGSGSSHDTDAGLRTHVTLRTCRAGSCTRDDHV
jgi:hypothetical protein